MLSAGLVHGEAGFDGHPSLRSLPYTFVVLSQKCHPPFPSSPTLLSCLNWNTNVPHVFFCKIIHKLYAKICRQIENHEISPVGTSCERLAAPKPAMVIFLPVVQALVHGDAMRKDGSVAAFITGIG